MATHDYEIANQTPANLRADLNNALQAIVTQNSGSSAPTTTFANMIWYDTANNQIKKRNEADTAWITLGTIDEASGKFFPNDGYVPLTFTPVQQGGGAFQSTNKIYIGWDGSGLRLQVDSTDLGTTWPIYANVTTANALAATAGASIGAVGTYIWAGQNAQTTYNAGQTYAGSSLVAAGFLSSSGFSDGTAADISGGYTLSGTWRAMGEANVATNRAPTTLFLRVA